MPDSQRIDPVLVEKVSKALYDLHPFDLNRPYTTGKRDAEAAIRVVFDELGLEEERKDWRGDGVRLKQPLVRYVSRWRPVEQGDANGD